jgi:ferredoxin
MAEAVNTQVIKERLEAIKGARMKMWLSLCAHCGLCAESCFFYLAHDRDPSYMPSYKVIKTLGELYKRKGEVDRAFLEEAYEIFGANAPPAGDAPCIVHLGSIWPP